MMGAEPDVGDVTGPVANGPVVALGNFDGVHLGHGKLIERALDFARGEGCDAIAVTFEPHPVAFFRPEAPPFLLTSPSERRVLLHKQGVRETVFLPFDGAMATMTPEAFVRNWLHDRLGASRVVVGDNFQFGKGKSGDCTSLARIAANFGISTEIVPLEGNEQLPISSTRIRDALRAGQMNYAARMLGRPVMMLAQYDRGLPAGSALFVPEKLKPASGCYQAMIQTGDRLALDAMVTVMDDPAGRRGFAMAVEPVLADQIADESVVVEFVSDCIPFLPCRNAIAPGPDLCQAPALLVRKA